MTVTALRPTPSIDLAAPAAARLSALTPWDFHPTAASARTRIPGLPGGPAGRGPADTADASDSVDVEFEGIRAAAWVARRRADVEALTPIAVTEEDVEVAESVARHLVATLADAPGVDAARRVLGGYDHHLSHHSFLLGAHPGLADILLWEAVIVLPLRLGEDGAAAVLRDLTALRPWVRRLVEAHGGAVAAIGRDGVGREHRRTLGSHRAIGPRFA